MQEFRLRRLEKLVKFLDYGIPIGKTGYRIGFDPLIGLIPGIGDLIGTAFAGYVVYEAHAMGASKWVLGRMLWNVLLDFLLGLFPILGDYADFVFKANAKNLALLKRHLERKTSAAEI